MTYTPNQTKPGNQTPTNTGNQANRPSNGATQPNMPKKNEEQSQASGMKKDGENSANKNDGTKKNSA